MNAFDYLLSVSSHDEPLRSKAIRIAISSHYLPDPGGYFESALRVYRAKTTYENVLKKTTK